MLLGFHAQLRPIGPPPQTPFANPLLLEPPSPDLPQGRAHPFASQLCCAGTCGEGGRSLAERMPLGLTLGSLGRSMRRKRLSSLDILSSKRAPRDYYKGKNCKPTGFHTRKGTISPSTGPAVLQVARALSSGLCFGGAVRQFVPVSCLQD